MLLSNIISNWNATIGIDLIKLVFLLKMDDIKHVSWQKQLSLWKYISTNFSCPRLLLNIPQLTWTKNPVFEDCKMFWFMTIQSREKFQNMFDFLMNSLLSLQLSIFIRFFYFPFYIIPFKIFWYQHFAMNNFKYLTFIIWV